MATLREQILGAADRLVAVPIPEWNVTIYVRRLTLPEKLAFEQQAGAFEELGDDREGRNRWILQYVLAVACDDKGQPIFSPEDEAALAGKSATALERVLLNALRVNVVRQEELVDLGKGFGGARNGASPSGSPAISG